MKLKNGTKIGDLEILRETRGGWWARCECGNEDFVAPKHITAGIRCCRECEKRKGEEPSDQGPNLKHGMSGTSIYRLWSRLKSWNRLCEDWDEFEAFYDVVGDRPTSEHRLIRPNADEPYHPRNFQWATSTDVARLHKRPLETWIEYHGEHMTVTQLAESTVGPTTIAHMPYGLQASEIR